MILMKGLLLAATLTACIAGVVYVYKLAEEKPDREPNNNDEDQSHNPFIR